jgi:hypothetical protein
MNKSQCNSDIVFLGTKLEIEFPYFNNTDNNSSSSYDTHACILLLIGHACIPLFQQCEQEFLPQIFEISVNGGCVLVHTQNNPRTRFVSTGRAESPRVPCVFIKVKYLCSRVLSVAH